MKKIICAILALFALLLPLTSCQKQAYVNNVSASALANTIAASLSGGQSYRAVAQGYLDDDLRIPDYVSEYTVLISEEGNDIDELGVFRVTDGNAKAMKKALEDFLAASYKKNADWYDSYIPAETPKLRDAEVRIFGNYAVYAILSTNNQEAAWAAAEKLLAEK